MCVSTKLYERTCLENAKMEPFPMQIERRLSITYKVVEIQVHCYCRCPDEGEKMVTCDGDYGIIYRNGIAKTVL